MKTLVVIPAHNESAKIAEVIRDLKKFGYHNILVVDDGSTDNTGKISQKCGAKVVTHVVNRGLGAGLGTGFEFAKRNGYNCLVTFDGDGQHEAKDIKRLLFPIQKGVCDVVIGSRLLAQKGMPWQRLIINHISNFSTLMLYRVRTTDATSGLRAFGKKALNQIKIKTDRMEVSNEFFWEIRRNSLKFLEIPIKAIYTEYSEKHSHNTASLWQAVYVGKGMLLRLFR
jgi:glycosyltransferase involved in cell wall biosynthesis